MDLSCGVEVVPNLLPDLSPSLAIPEDTRPARKYRTQSN